MKHQLHNATVRLRRGVVSLVQMVPVDVRERLARNPLLTRVYEFFDAARYQPVLDAEGYRGWRDSGRPLHDAMPLHAYRYEPPQPGRDERERLAALAGGPLISVLMPVHDTPPPWLRAAIASLQAQWYPRWELCLADDHSTRADTLELLATLDDPRIRQLRLPANGNIAAASNAALSLARGEYVALMDHDDELAPDALFRVAESVVREQPDFIYSDEDKLEPDGRHSEPHYKPQWAPDHLLSQNYISHLAVIRRTLVEAVGGFTVGLEGAQDYDLYLRVLERSARIVHLPRVLYHWRRSGGSTARAYGRKDYVQAAGRRALQAAVTRRGLAASVEDGLHEGTYRVRHAIPGEPLVSIVVPFRDRPELLDTCLGAILARTGWRRFEIVGVDNGSRDPRTRAAMERWAAADPRVRFHSHDVPFNYSAINNHAVREWARGELVLLLNNDVEVTAPGWLEALIEHACRPEIGAVGGKLLYPDRRVQHAGVVLGIGGLAGHSHKGVPTDKAGYFARLRIVHNVAAVTGACLMVRRATYLEAGGLEEDHLAVAFNDVDFCLRLMERGLRNLYTPYCEAIHHESASRGHEDTPQRRARFDAEVQWARQRHAALLTRGDPYYNPNLTLGREDYSLAVSGQRKDPRLAVRRPGHGADDQPG